MDFVRSSLIVGILQCLLLLAVAQKQNPLETTTTCVKKVYIFILERLEMLTDLKEEQKEELTAILNKEIQKIIENEKKALEQKYKKRRVQFTRITDEISANQRIFSQMEAVISDFKNKTEVSFCGPVKCNKVCSAEEECVTTGQVCGAVAQARKALEGAPCCEAMECQKRGSFCGDKECKTVCRAEEKCVPTGIVCVKAPCCGAMECQKGEIEKPRQSEFSLENLLEELHNSCILGNNICFTHPGQDAVCNPNLCSDRYRRSDGVCNNLESKHWGATAIPMRRLVSTAYDFGTEPRGGFASSLPSTRDISSLLHKSILPEATTLSSKGLSLMTMQFAQFLDHDTTLTPEEELDCCDQEFLKWDSNPDETPLHVRRCFNIPVSEPQFGDPPCHSLTRSGAICVSDKDRTQINGLTAYVDGSNIYGSDQFTSTQLREMSNGLLKTNSNQNLNSVPNLPSKADAGLTNPANPMEDPNDLVAGDIRVIEQPTLASIHTLFLNEHNRIAQHLKDCLPEVLQGDDILYEETRKIVGAELQNIVYEEFLPLILGEDTMNAFNLKLSDATTYNPGQDPSIVNEFATVAYRFGHTLIPDIFQGNGPRFLKNDFFEFENTVTCPFTALPNAGKCWMDEMKEVINQQSPANDMEIADAVRQTLFIPEIPNDLMARNLQRGRDHGIPDYLTFLDEAKKICPNLTLDSIPQSRFNLIVAAYNGDKDIIDPFTGGLAETPAVDAVVGPLFACVIGEQFRRLKDGDRYFFTHTSGSEHVRGLGPHTKSSVRKRRLGDIICENTDVEETQVEVMKQTSLTNPLQSCYDKNPLNFECIADDIIRDKIDCAKKEMDTIEKEGEAKLDPNLQTLKEQLADLEIALESSKCTFTPAPGNCASKDSVPVAVDMAWTDNCADSQGNQFQPGASLLSCCGCFKYTCTADTNSRYEEKFSWVKTLGEECCQTCDGEVYPGGSVISRTEGGECGSTVTRECVSYGNGQPSNIEERYSYTECCVNRKGFHPLGTTQPDPSTCSMKHCEHSPGRAEAVWVSKQACAGCGCCEYNGSLLCDGHNMTLPRGELLRCCEGEIIKEKTAGEPRNKLYNCGNSVLENMFLEAITPIRPQDKFCMAFDDGFDTDDKTSYIISADLYNHQSSRGSGYGHLGLAYNMLDTDTYEGLYLRVHSSNCIQMFHNNNGNLLAGFGFGCTDRPVARTWFNLKIAVDHMAETAQIYINGVIQPTGQLALKLPAMPRGAVVVHHGHKNQIFYKNFKIIKTL